MPGREYNYILICMQLSNRGLLENQNHITLCRTRWRRDVIVPLKHITNMPSSPSIPPDKYVKSVFSHLSLRRLHCFPSSCALSEAQPWGASVRRSLLDFLGLTQFVFNELSNCTLVFGFSGVATQQLPCWALLNSSRHAQSKAITLM